MANTTLLPQWRCVAVITCQVCCWPQVTWLAACLGTNSLSVFTRTRCGRKTDSLLQRNHRLCDVLCRAFIRSADWAGVARCSRWSLNWFEYCAAVFTGQCWCWVDVGRLHIEIQQPLRASLWWWMHLKACISDANVSLSISLCLLRFCLLFIPHAPRVTLISPACSPMCVCQWACLILRTPRVSDPLRAALRLQRHASDTLIAGALSLHSLFFSFFFFFLFYFLGPCSSVCFDTNMDVFTPRLFLKGCTRTQLQESCA